MIKVLQRLKQSYLFLGHLWHLFLSLYTNRTAPGFAFETLFTNVLGIYFDDFSDLYLSHFFPPE